MTEAQETPAGGAMDQQALHRFCEIWADSGYVDPTDEHYVLFDTYSIEDVSPELHAELLSLIGTLGLERVETPAGQESGEIWVKTVPFIDAVLEQYS